MVREHLNAVKLKRGNAAKYWCGIALQKYSAVYHLFLIFSCHLHVPTLCKRIMVSKQFLPVCIYRNKP